ncbi:MAG: CPBP family intramembrane glutamic endopeptidase [Myxococcota bacterium]
MLWAKVTGPLVGLWLVLHGPRLPGSMPPQPAPELPLLLGGVLLAGGLILLVAALGVLLTPEVAPPKIIGEPGQRPGLRLYLASTAAVLGVSLLLEAVAGAAGFGQDGELGRMQRTFSALGLGERAWTALVIGLAPAFTEEIAFRGWVLSRIAAASGPRVAVAFSAAAFGIFHFDPAHAAVTTAMGLVLGMATVRTGALGPAIVAHAVNNGLGVTTAGASLGGFGWMGLAGLGLGLGVWGTATVLTETQARPQRT